MIIYEDNCNIRPKTTNKEVIKQLIDVGVDIFRLNFSHFYENQFNNMISIIRSIDKDMDIMADLQGKKVRVDESLKMYLKYMKMKQYIFADMMVI